MKTSAFLTAITFSFAIGTGQSQTYISAYSEGSNLWGYMTVDGTHITEPVYQSISNFSTDGYATGVDSKTRKPVLIGAAGEIIPLPVDKATDLIYIGEQQQDPSLKSVIFKVGNQYGIVTTSGRVTHQAAYDKIYPTDYPFTVARVGDLHSLLYLDGSVIALPATIVDVRQFKNGLAPYRESVSDAMGFINLKGEVAIPATYQSVGYFELERAWVKTTDSKVGFIDRSGKVVIEPVYTMAKEFDPVTKRALARRGETYLFLTPDGTEITPDAEKLGQFQEGLAEARKGDLYGFVGPSGEWIIPAKYDKVEPFKDGFARVKLDGKWGIIDKKGTEIVAPAYSRLEDYHNGLAAFYTGSYWGYLDQKGEIAIPAKFDGYDHFSNGYAVVKEKKKSGIIDTKGTFVVAPEYIKIQPVSKVSTTK